MKILFIADIHGITTNLNYIKTLDEKEKFNKIVILGDIYYQGLKFNSDMTKVNSIDVKDFLNEYHDRIICLKGNCDSDVDIKASNFPICNLVLINVEGLNIYCTHGNKHNYEKGFKGNGVLVYGHHHIPYIKKKDDMIYICVGSISIPEGGSNASYGIYNNKTFTIYEISGEELEKINF